MLKPIVQLRPSHNLPVSTFDQRPTPLALALSTLRRRHRVRGPVARVIAELALLGREVQS